MGISHKISSGLGISFLLLTMPSLAASSSYSHPADDSMEEVESNVAEAEALVDDQLVDDVVARYPYPLPEDVQLNGEGGEISADQAQWHDELVEYWEEFPYDEVASAYGCEIHDLEISDSGEGVPTRSYGIDCETSEDSEALSATIDRIETEAAENTRSEVGEALTEAPLNERCGSDTAIQMRICLSINTANMTSNASITNQNPTTSRLGNGLFYTANVECAAGNRELLDSATIDLSPNGGTLRLSSPNPVSTWYRATWSNPSTSYCAIV